MTPVSFVKTTESYEVSLVTINQQTSYESGILRQDYGTINAINKSDTTVEMNSTVQLGYCDSDVTVCLLFWNRPIIQDRDVKFPYKRYRYYLQAF